MKIREKFNKATANFMLWELKRLFRYKMNIFNRLKDV